MSPGVRLQKYMSEAGICSRRKAEEYIINGLVFVNGEKASIGQSVDPEIDAITFNDEIVEDKKKLVYYVLNKPRGVLSSCNSLEGQTVVDLVPVAERVFPIGRLDKDTTGLIILTNDGRLTNYLIHPRYNHEKEYVVETYGPIGDEALKKMSQGVFILGRYTRKTEVKRLSSGSFSIILREGRNRQIRRMVEAVGKEVKRLKRIRIENILLGSLGEGQYRKIEGKELSELFKKIGIT